MADRLNVVDMSFNSAAEELKKGRMVACVEAYPVLPVSQASHATKQYFLDHPHEIITNDGRAIYYSQDNIMKVRNELGVSINQSDVHDYLIREYAHLFLQHSRLRKHYEKEEIKLNTFMVACEIEACRTRGISHTRTCYQTSATEDLFPCTKGAEYLRQIYQSLVDEYGDEIEQYANGGSSQNGEGQQQSGNGGESGDSNRADKQSGDGDDSGDGGAKSNADGGGGVRSSRDDSADSDGNNGGDLSDQNGNHGGRDSGEPQDDQEHGKGKSRRQRKSGESDSGNGQSGGTQSGGQTNSQQRRGDGNSSEGGGEHQQGNGGLPSAGGGKLTDKQKEQLAKTFARNEEKLSPADGDDAMLLAYGYSPDGYSEERPLNELIELTYDRWRDKQVKNQLKKLKSAIEGVVSKKKHDTYARPSRRACVSNGLLTKGRKKDLVGQPTILVALDASGSMEAQRIKDLTTTIGNIFDDLGRPKKGCYICMFDTKIIDYKPMRQWKKIVERYSAVGGTDYPCVTRLANALDVDIVIEVGDGQGCVSDNWRQGRELTEFLAHNRKWYDVLVLHNKDELQWTMNNHVDYDRRTCGIERQVICLDKQIALELKKYQNEG